MWPNGASQAEALANDVCYYDGGGANMRVTRREFVRHAVVGAAAFLGGGVVSRYLPLASAGRQYGTRRRLSITEALVTMVDGTPVYHWAFEDLDQLKPQPQMPGPVILTTEGDEVHLSITNSLHHGPHGFRIPGVQGQIGVGVVIEPGETQSIDFVAPKGGSYVYFDHLNDPVNRVLGLHGPMIVLPKAGSTPYSAPTAAVQRLFDDLGKTAHFPGERWVPERSRIWLFNSIDPVFNAAAQRGEQIDARQFSQDFLPRFFTINGLSGAFAAHDSSIVPSGRIGQPHVVRLMNAGMAWHSPHLHGNHFYVLAKVDESLTSQVVQENVLEIDTVAVRPLERLDWLIPFTRPPDIPGNPAVPLRTLLRSELALTLGNVGQSPLSYPMHCHMEMSQTAAGGNYPHGLVTRWEITGDLDGIDFSPSTPNEKGGINSEYHTGGGQ